MINAGHCKLDELCSTTRYCEFDSGRALYQVKTWMSDRPPEGMINHLCVSLVTQVNSAWPAPLSVGEMSTIVTVMATTASAIGKDLASSAHITLRERALLPVLLAN